jgi:putative ABC transport system substrate-binding protein
LEGNIDILLGVFDSVVLTRETARPLISFSFHQKLPLMSVSESWVKAGSLLAIDRDYEDYGGQIGAMAKSILAGKTPLSIPPEDPNKQKLFLNQRTADLIRIVPPVGALEDVTIINP